MEIRKVIQNAEVAQALHESFDLISVGNQVLDIGFGDGELVAQFLEFGYYVTGVEKNPIKPLLIDSRLKKANIVTDKLTIIKMAVEDFTFVSNSYSAIIC